MMQSIFQNKRLSLLGFGTMRLPTIKANGSAVIDENAVHEMVRTAHAHGFYFAGGHLIAR